MSEFTKRKGTVAMLVELPPELQFPMFGPSGAITLPAGYYLHVEPAFYAGGVLRRVNHTLMVWASPHFTLDYVHPEMAVHEAWVTYDPVERVCQWAGLVQDALGGQVVTPGFWFVGTCGCQTHCFYFEERPAFETFEQDVARLIPDHAPVHRVSLGRAAFPVASGGPQSR